MKAECSAAPGTPQRQDDPDSILLTLSSLHKANRNVPVKGCKEAGTSLGAKPARAAGLWSLLFIPAIPQSCWHLPYRDFLIKTFILLSCGSSIFVSVVELCQSHCGQEVRNGTPTLILHLAARASPSLANPSDGSSGSALPLPVRGLTDTWDLSWPMEQPQMCCSPAWQCTVYLQACPTPFRVGRCS